MNNFFKGYQKTAVILLNSIILFILINILASLYIYHNNHKNKPANKIFGWYGNDIDLSAVYPDMNAEQINTLLNETWTRTYAYEPYTQFKERQYSGQYVNVSEFGFRMNGHVQPWPPKKDSEIIVFIFGGSTTFGYGVPDSQTIAAYLEKNLKNLSNNKKFRVYNFGRGYYFSSQERVLLEYLIEKGQIPHIAIFIDGLNEFYQLNDEGPEFTLMIKSFLEEQLYEKNLSAHKRTKTVLKEFILSLPVVQFFYPVKPLNMAQEFHKTKNYDSPELFDLVVKRYNKNKKMIEALGKKFGFKTKFIFQPVPTYKYDTNYHIFQKFGYGVHQVSKYGYPFMAKHISENPMGEDFHWFADIQDGLKQPLYVDSAHYCPKFNEIIAQKIINEMKTVFLSAR